MTELRCRTCNLCRICAGDHDQCPYVDIGVSIETAKYHRCVSKLSKERASQPESPELKSARDKEAEASERDME